jgi:hypothetical protein
MASYQTPQDEGYSEDPLTIQGSGDERRRGLMESAVQEWLSTQPVAERAREFMLEMMEEARSGVLTGFGEQVLR